ncbi:long-chain-fatty-acid--CoA ligase [Rubeoparvulum massiliense]|uniref:long-chain-fatty-acid--CoA ligase n=1 Tax=Rubeoparvulum massiliense TaxID=1631346 RepID=UPI00065DF9EB|nr:long-chain-fatty-acid--CoA ligase [Rubeoparvulum massiliense]
MKKQDVEERVWLRHYPPEIPKSIHYPEVSLVTFLLDSAHRFPDKEVIFFMGKRIRYKQLLDAVYRLAHALRDLGIEKGDRVAIMLPNSPQAVIAYYATLLIGGVVVQTNPLYTERELEHQLIDSGTKVLVALDLVYPRIKAVREKANLQHVIITSVGDYLPFPKNWLYPFVQRKQKQAVNLEGEVILKWHALLQAQPDTPIPPVEINAKEDLALLQYTGGTTGLPKGCMLTHYNLVANVLQTRHWIYKSEFGKERVLAALPFFHVYGMTTVMNLTLMIAGSMVVIPRFQPEEVLKLIEKERPTLFPGAPTMYIALINHPEIHQYDLSSIFACISGSAPLHLEVQQRFEELTNGKIVEGYGLTESSPVTHANLIWGERVNGSIGLPWPDTEAAIMDEEGNFLPPRAIGELVVRGPQVMKGYWQRPEETEMTLREGWLLTGDMGYMDEEGYFYIVDRKKDMIIASGYNIYPREIEEILFEHPAIQEAAVAGIPDEYRGETVKAFVVVKEGMTVTEEELDQFCREKLASYKIPRIYEFREQLPKTTVGKVLRRQLVQEDQAN